MSNCFAPNINLFRDPRWGRGSETFGEDPALTAQLAVAFVRGLQGGHPRYLQVGATCKHLAAYSLEEWEGVTRHEFDAAIDARDARDAYLPAFRACVTQAAPQSVMCSYNRVNGTPACASSWLLGEQLRRRWGFRGLVVSDCGAIEDIADNHGWAATQAEGAAAALKAGTDLACQDYSRLGEALERGLVGLREIDAALHRLLLARAALGHFDGPADHNPFRRIPLDVVGSREHLALAREAATKSIVLLKNMPVEPAAASRDPPEVEPCGATRAAVATASHAAGATEDGAAGARAGAAPLLPLRLHALRRLAVIGPFANRSEYLLGSGSYYGRPAGELASPYEAIAQRAAQAGVQAELFTGTEVMGQGADTLAASAACTRSDVCIFFVGNSALMSAVREVRRYGGLPLFSPVVEGEGWDRDALGLPGKQLNLIQGVARRTRTPIVVVLIHGAPLEVGWLHSSPRVGAILSAWTSGQGAAAIADIFFGEVSPAGRLPATFYFANFTAQSSFADMSMRRWPGRTHRHVQVPVLYPFGHGLSYTTFAYSRLSLDMAAGTAAAGGRAAAGTAAAQVAAGAAEAGAIAAGCLRGCTAPLLRVSVDITNIGGMAADEVALLLLSYAGPQGQCCRDSRHSSSSSSTPSSWELRAGGLPSRALALEQCCCTALHAPRPAAGPATVVAAAGLRACPGSPW